MSLRTSICGLVALSMMAVVPPCAAQAVQPGATPSSAPMRVLNGKQLDEDTIIKELQLTAPEGAAEEGVATRGFHGRGDKLFKPAPVAAGPGKLGVLITFVTNSSELTTEARSMLDKMAGAFNSDALVGYQFRIEGHADARGDSMSNSALSLRRAESVLNYLVTQHNIVARRLSAVGKGSTELLNTQRVDAPENRRVVFVTVRDSQQ